MKACVFAEIGEAMDPDDLYIFFEGFGDGGNQSISQHRRRRNVYYQSVYQYFCRHDFFDCDDGNIRVCSTAR